MLSWCWFLLHYLWNINLTLALESSRRSNLIFLSDHKRQLCLLLKEDWVYRLFNGLKFFGFFNDCLRGGEPTVCQGLDTNFWYIFRRMFHFFLLAERRAEARPFLLYMDDELFSGHRRRLCNLMDQICKPSGLLPLLLLFMHLQLFLHTFLGLLLERFLRLIKLLKKLQVTCWWTLERRPRILTVFDRNLHTGHFLCPRIYTLFWIETKFVSGFDFWFIDLLNCYHFDDRFWIHIWYSLV